MPVQLAKDLALGPSHGSPAAAETVQRMSSRCVWQLYSRVPNQQAQAAGATAGRCKLVARCMLTHKRARVQPAHTRSSHPYSGCCTAS